MDGRIGKWMEGWMDGSALSGSPRHDVGKG